MTSITADDPKLQARIESTTNKIHQFFVDSNDTFSEILQHYKIFLFFIFIREPAEN